MISNMPECPICTFPMSVSIHGTWQSCRACGYNQYKQELDNLATDNRYDNSIFEMPRDEFMKSLDERYREGMTKGWLCGGLLSVLVAAIISGIFLIIMAREVNEILDKAQGRQFLPRAIPRGEK